MGSRRTIGLVAPLAAVMMAQSTVAQCHYDVTVIQAPDCGIFPEVSIGTAINVHGHIVGYSWVCGNPGLDQAFLWTPEAGYQGLVSPPGSTGVRAFDISDDGLIVGRISGGLPFRGFVYDHGEWTVLSPLLGDLGESNAFAIDAVSNCVVGTRSIGVGPVPRNAFLWTAETGIVDLGLFGEMNSEGFGIGHGAIVGFAGDAVTTAGRALIVRGDETILLDPIAGGVMSIALDINASGLVCGWGRLEPGKGEVVGHRRGFAWDGTTMIELPPLAPFERSRANAVSGRGVIVGRSWWIEGNINAQVGTIWLDYAPLDVNAFVSTAPTLQIVDVQGINEEGQMVVCAVDGGRVVVARLDPIAPSPADLDGDCDTDHADVTRLLEDWGAKGSIADLNQDEVVDALDFLFLLAHWS